MTSHTFLATLAAFALLAAPADVRIPTDLTADSYFT